MLTSSVFLQTSIPNIPSITVLSSTSSLQHELRFEQPCTQDLRSCASQDTVQSEQRSLGKTGPNLPHRLIRQRDARGSPFSSLLSKSVYLLSGPQRTRDRGCGSEVDRAAALGRLPRAPIERAGR